jgi:hypothetical protein
MHNDTTALILQSHNDETFGTQKLFFSYQKKLLWEYHYDFLIDSVAGVFISGLDTEPKTNKIDSLAEAIKYINTSRVLVIDFDNIFFSSKDLNNLLSKKKPSVTLCVKSQSNLFCKKTLTTLETTDYVDIVPVQLFDTSLLKRCILQYRNTIKNKNPKDICSVVQKYCNVVPELVYADSISAKKLLDKTDIKLLESI